MPRAELKPLEPVYEWQWYNVRPTDGFYTEKDLKGMEGDWHKLEHSKRAVAENGVKQGDTVYEWQWYSMESTESFYTEAEIEETHGDWRKVEYSRRERK